MKKVFISMLTIATLLVTGCSDDDSNDGSTTPTEGELKGNITADLALNASTEYTLKGALIVKEGATLTIPAGTTIKAVAGGTDVYILVERGGKIIADGTANSPITITSSADNPAPGDWGGLIINGKAPISRQAGAPNEAATEVNNSVLFGGDNPADNSGILDYVVLEYTGARINEEAEHNGCTLNGVGNGTQISNLVIKNGDDDGIEWFGGTVNVTNLLVVNAKDDCFDVSQGWSGKLTNAYGIREEGYTAVTSDPRGVEADGNLDGKSPTDINQSNFTMENITIFHNATGVELSDGIKVRRGATANITNALVVLKTIEAGDDKTKYSDFVDLTDKRGYSNDATTVNASGVNVDTTDIKLDDTEEGTDIPATTATVTVPDTVNTGADTAAFSWTGYNFPAIPN